MYQEITTIFLFLIELKKSKGLEGEDNQVNTNGGKEDSAANATERGAKDANYSSFSFVNKNINSQTLGLYMSKKKKILFHHTEK